MRAVEPEGWARGRGFTHAFATEGDDVVLFSGVNGADRATEELVDGGMAEQVAQSFRNVAEVVKAAGSDPSRVMFLRIYVTDRDAYMSSLREIGRAFRDVFDTHFPAMTFLVVSGLFVPEALVEIDGVAAIG